MTAVAQQTQFYYGLVGILPAGGTGTPAIYPVLPGVQVSAPENYAVPPILGNFWQYSFGQGGIVPTLDCSFVVHDIGSEVMQQSFWDMFTARSNDSAHNTTPVDVIFWDGYDGVKLTNARADSFSLSCSWGGDITISAHFIGTGYVPLTTRPTGFTGWSNANILRFKNLVFASPLDNQIFDFGLTFSNNTTPINALNGSEFPADTGAGMMTSSFQCTSQIKTGDIQNNGLFPPPSVLNPIQFTIVGSAANAVFTAANPIDNTRRNRNVAAGRVMRSHSFLLLGGTSETTPPLSVVVTAHS